MNLEFKQCFHLLQFHKIKYLLTKIENNVQNLYQIIIRIVLMVSMEKNKIN